MTVLAGSAPGIGQNDTIVDGVLSPTFLQELVCDLFYGNPARLSSDRTKDIVVIVTLMPVQSTILARAEDASRERLVDVDVLDVSFVYGVLYGESEREQGDCTSLEPRHALQAEDLFGAVTEDLVLLPGLATMTKDAIRKGDHEEFAAHRPGSDIGWCCHGEGLGEIIVPRLL